MYILGFFPTFAPRNPKMVGGYIDILIMNKNDFNGLKKAVNGGNAEEISNELSNLIDLGIKKKHGCVMFKTPIKDEEFNVVGLQVVDGVVELLGSPIEGSEEEKENVDVIGGGINDIGITNVADKILEIAECGSPYGWY